jgi:hypothetical protein
MSAAAVETSFFVFAPDLREAGTAEVTTAAAHGARGIDFHHYGLVSDDALQRVRTWRESPACQPPST